MFYLILKLIRCAASSIKTMLLRSIENHLSFSVFLFFNYLSSCLVYPEVQSVFCFLLNHQYWYLLLEFFFAFFKVFHYLLNWQTAFEWVTFKFWYSKLKFSGYHTFHLVHWQLQKFKCLNTWNCINGCGFTTILICSKLLFTGFKSNLC